MCESKCASGPAIMCEYGDVRVVRSKCASEYEMCECEYGDERVNDYVQVVRS